MKLRFCQTAFPVGTDYIRTNFSGNNKCKGTSHKFPSTHRKKVTSWTNSELSIPLTTNCIHSPMSNPNNIFSQQTICKHLRKFRGHKTMKIRRFHYITNRGFQFSNCSKYDLGRLSNHGVYHI
jgi:hypothetical protein